MEEGFSLWANPSSPHAEGRRARAALEDARARIKAALGWQGEVIFTSGASEALAIALTRAAAQRRLASRFEHDALWRALPEAEVCTDAARLGPGALLAAQHVNSETGTRDPSGWLAAQPPPPGTLVLADCAQSAGRLPLPAADMIVVSAHKFGGPIGVGALLLRDFSLISPCGGHERGYRQGTENLPGVLGMAAALEAGGRESWATSAEDRARFAAQMAPWRLVPGDPVDYIFALAHPHLSAQALLIRLDSMGLAVSAGSACSSGTLKKSRVLDAFGVADEVAARTIRVSLGWNTRPEELARFVEAWEALA